MALSNDEIVALAKRLRESFAGANLPRPLAKLYSQYTHIRANQPGLVSLATEETAERTQRCHRFA